MTAHISAQTLEGIHARETKTYSPVLQAIFPALQVCTEESLYFHRNDKALYDFSTQSLVFEQGGMVFTDTYFNGFSAGKFKRHTALKSLFFRMRGEGTFHLSFRLLRYGYSATVLHETMYEAGYDREPIPLPFYASVADSILFVKLHCLSPAGKVTAMAFETTDEPLRDVKLGVVVTHFKRERQVMAAIQRLRSGLLDQHGGDIQLFVIDNSNTLEEQPPSEHVHIIANRNFGGSGGFTRGLLTLLDSGTFTHCLFMDDDASCEIESIRRTYMFLQYASDPARCVAGALLWENFPYLQYENGAAYEHGMVRPLKLNRDLRDPVNVMLNELEEKVDYGAWWFFAFPIAHVKHFAFPFFVRGDDITFSLQNDLSIITLNGVCCWGESFTHKIAAQERYLTMRSTLQMALMNRPSAASRDTALRFFKNQVMHDLKTCNYDRALLMCEAMDDVLKGKDFWMKNVSLDARRKALAALVTNEKPQLMDGAHELPSGVYGIDEGWFRKVVRKCSLNGHLIPDALLKQETFRLDRYMENMPKHTFRKKHMVYYDTFTRQGYTVEHSKKKFFHILTRCLKGYLAYRRTFYDLARQFSGPGSECMSEAFWRKQYTA